MHKKIKTFLHTSDTVTEEIRPEDKICKTCYKMHSSILSELATQPTSIDGKLLENIGVWEQAQKDAESLLTKAVLEAVIIVVKSFLQNKALLLSSVRNIVLEAYMGEIALDGISSLDVTIETGDSSIKFTSRWLLHQLIAHLKICLDFCCVHQKFGTIIYKHNGNLLTSLSWTLGGIANKMPSVNPIKEDQTCSCITLSGSPRVFNDLLHKEINQVSTASTTKNPVNFSIDDFIKEVNPQIVEFLQVATQSTRKKC